ncbi:MAG: hypothetical protein WB767_00355 [Nocardioides sp.]
MTPSRSPRARWVAATAAIATSFALAPAVSSASSADARSAAIQLAGEVAAPGNTLGAKLLTVTFDRAEATREAGQAFTVSGTVSKVVPATLARVGAGVPASFTLQVVDADGAVLASQQVNAGPLGEFSTSVPAAATAGLAATGDEHIAVPAVDAALPGGFAAEKAGAAAVTLRSRATGLVLHNSFTSAVGWVKPGERYDSRVLVINPTRKTIAGATVRIAAPLGSTLLKASGPGRNRLTDDLITWKVGAVKPGRTATLVVASKAATLAQVATIVWRDLSTTATLSGAGRRSTATAHGPKVIPPSDLYETARYGDRPFPVVPVQYTDRPWLAKHAGGDLERVINDASFEGSTFNLMQEISVGQLFPHGTVPSAGIASRGFDTKHDYEFSHRQPPELAELADLGVGTPLPSGLTCLGGTFADLPVAPGSNPLYTERITNGVYNLPGDTNYYGQDTGSQVAESLVGLPLVSQRDTGCGPSAKLVFDAATISDPEIDYSDYDTDKDGLVDFLMVVFAGCGGNGASQLGLLVDACTTDPQNLVPYDNVWQHSSSLEYTYTDPETGQTGYVSDDQLKDLAGQRLWYKSAARTSMTRKKTKWPVYVRVGPYNVNDEVAIERASVISHEYGHSLGLPDFYSNADRETYGDWNLMATDKSQNMDAFARQELGWVVPQVLTPGTSKSVKRMADSKQDINRIHWRTADGTPYVLKQGRDGRVQNAQMYAAKLPGRRLFQKDVLRTGAKASGSHVYWSGSGDEFGCTPQDGHNLDLVVPGLAQLPGGSKVSLSMKHWWEIEEDWDYGFVMTTTDGGRTYKSHASTKGTTARNTSNPNDVGCFETYDNGVTGNSGGGGEPKFVADTFDVSDLAGKRFGALRFSYFTDPALSFRGWLIDDLVVTATLPSGKKKVLMRTTFEERGASQDDRFFNGGCQDTDSTATKCTDGWTLLKAGARSDLDHGYYFELRDRSGFDLDGNGQIDRDPIAFQPGLSLSYTDEAHGYGNVGNVNPPAQSVLDAKPQAGENFPNLNDAAFRPGDDRASFSDFGSGHVDNYTDPERTRVKAAGNVNRPWRFDYNCLAFTVTRMSGQGTGPQKADGDLNADVRLKAGKGCAPFDYGYDRGAGRAQRPSATREPLTEYAAPVAGPAVANLWSWVLGLS